MAESTAGKMHVTPEGLKVCHATQGGCPYGANGHYDPNNPEEMKAAEQKYQELHGSNESIGMGVRAGNKMTDAYKGAQKGHMGFNGEITYDKAEKTADESSSHNAIDMSSMNKFCSKYIDKKRGIFNSGSDFRGLNHELGRMSSAPMNSDAQKRMMDVVKNPDYMKRALSHYDDSELPAATESFNILASNPSTSSENMHALTGIAVQNKGNNVFRKQVYVTDIVNHPNTSESDANALYNAYPEETVRAQHCPTSIVDRAITEPGTPERARAIALTNPNASPEAVSKALQSGSNIMRAQAMLNPNGTYLDALHTGNVSRKPLDGGNDFTDSELNSADKFMNRLKGVSAKN